MIWPPALLLLLASSTFALPPFKKVLLPKATPKSPACSSEPGDRLASCNSLTNTTVLQPTKRERRPFEYEGFDEFYSEIKNDLLGDNAEDIEKGVATAKMIIDEVEPLLDSIDVIPGVSAITALMRMGSKLLGLFGMVAGGKPDVAEAVKNLRTDMRSQFDRLNQKLDQVLQAINQLSAKVDALFAKSDFKQYVEMPLRDLLTAQQAFLQGPTEISRQRFLISCVNNDPLYIWDRLKTLLEEDFLRLSLRAVNYSKEELYRLDEHILKHINTAILIEGMCLQLRSESVTDVDYAHSSAKAAEALDASEKALNNFLTWAWDNLIVFPIEQVIEKMWDNRSLEPIQEEIEKILHPHQYWANDYVAMFNRDTAMHYNFYYSHQRALTFKGLSYQFFIFSRENATECSVPNISEKHILPEYRNGDWSKVAEAIYISVAGECHGHSVAVRKVPVDYTASPQFKLQKDMKGFLGYDHFAIFTY